MTSIIATAAIISAIVSILTIVKVNELQRGIAVQVVYKMMEENEDE